MTSVKWVASRLAIDLPDLDDQRLKAIQDQIVSARATTLKENPDRSGVHPRSNRRQLQGVCSGEDLCVVAPLHGFCIAAF
jgi:hypothetical protein